jgi:hypothetical protein
MFAFQMNEHHIYQSYLKWIKKKALKTECFRAKDEIRTRDPDLGKVVLYQLSYFRIFACANLLNFSISPNFIQTFEQNH